MPRTGSIATRYALDVRPPRSIAGIIDTNSLSSVVKTAMTKVSYEDEQVNAMMAAMTPWGRWGTAEDVAKGALFLASDDAAWVTGIPLPVDGGYLAQ